MNPNNSSLPVALTNLIEAFSALPGVGHKTAERYAYACLKSDKAKSLRLAVAWNHFTAMLSVAQSPLR